MEVNEAVNLLADYIERGGADMLEVQGLYTDKVGERTCACPMACALIGSGMYTFEQLWDEDTVVFAHVKELMRELGLGDITDWKHPVQSRQAQYGRIVWTLDGMVVDLNDKWNWTRQEIVEWLRKGPERNE